MKPLFKLATKDGRLIGGHGPRPIETHYKGGQVSRSCSPKQAARAAVKRVTDGDYTGAQIYKKEVLVATVDKLYNRVVLTILRPRMFK